MPHNIRDFPIFIETSGEGVYIRQFPDSNVHIFLLMFPTSLALQMN